MKLLFYSHAFSPQIGGVETFSMHLACGLAQGNHGVGATPAHVTVVTQTTPGHSPEVPQAPFPIIRRPRGRRLWQLIGGADKVVLAGPAILPLFFALIRRKPVVVTHHGYQSICPNGMLFQFATQCCCPGHFAAGRYLECLRCNAPQETAAGSTRSLLLTFLRRGLSWFANSNVAVSEHVARRIALPRVQVIRNGVPDPPPVREVVRDSASQPHSVCFAYIGRLVTEKGVPVLIDAAGILKKRDRFFRVLVIGDGPERAALQAQACSLGLGQEVVFLGYLMGEQLDEAMTGVSALVMPSICEDAAPFSVLEQMMQSRLIIASDLGGLAEQVGDAGLLFEAGNSSALADQMQSVIDDPRPAAKFECRARERALNLYSLDRMLQEYRTLLQRV